MNDRSECPLEEPMNKAAMWEPRAILMGSFEAQGLKTICPSASYRGTLMGTTWATRQVGHHLFVNPSQVCVRSPF